MKISNEGKKRILGQLWEDAVFNDKSYKILEEIVITQSKKKDPLNITNLEIPEESYFALSASRNRHLISDKNQDILRKTVVAFFGLSVGSHGALTWMMESRADVVKIIDPDTIDATNLNRLRFGFEVLGEYKTDVVKRLLESINPFVKVIALKDTEQTAVTKLIFDKPSVDLIVDEIDDLEGKILLRKLARRKKIPVISAVDVGDNVFLDIERFDLDPKQQFFLGKIPNIDHLNLTKLSDLERKKMIIKLVGFEKNSEEMLESLLALGRTLGTWPQLGATATISGGVITTAIKKIILGESIKSGRYYICLDEILASDFNSSSRKMTREKLIRKVNEKLNLKNG